MTQESNQYSKILSDYGLINNNIIYLVSHSEFVNNYQGNNLSAIVGLYWDGYVSDYTETKLKSEYASINKLIEDIEQSGTELLKISNSRYIDNQNQNEKENRKFQKAKKKK
jgi:methionine salvage enolase-phosphatase E1